MNRAVSSAMIRSLVFVSNISYFPVLSSDCCDIEFLVLRFFLWRFLRPAPSSVAAAGMTRSPLWTFAHPVRLTRPPRFSELGSKICASTWNFFVRNFATRNRRRKRVVIVEISQRFHEHLLIPLLNKNVGRQSSRRSAARAGEWKGQHSTRA